MHRRALYALVSQGVFDGTGCGDGKLCPAGYIARWEMAVVLVRIVHGSEPPRVPRSRFVDVDASQQQQWWADHVELVAELSITRGCTSQPLSYCPDQTVTRAQMASFLVRAFKLPAATPAGFTDTAGSVHAADIDALYAAGITTGCRADPLSYCPDRSVTRQEMASFLQRAIDHRDRNP